MLSRENKRVIQCSKYPIIVFANPLQTFNFIAKELYAQTLFLIRQIHFNRVSRYLESAEFPLNIIANVLDTNQITDKIHSLHFLPKR